MGDNTPTDQSNEHSDLTGKIRKRMLQVVVQLLILAATLFISSGRLNWTWAWIYLGVGIGILAVNTLVMPPELIAERGRTDKMDKAWDRVITTINILPSLGAPVVAGLDERFGWSPQFSPEIHLIGLALMVLGQGLFTWSMMSNRFFSTSVRIQVERYHTVATGGPYRAVRHPGYVGYILSAFAMPLALGSLWALIPAGLTMCLLVVRTAFEDKTLLEELDGYTEYAQQTQYRLLPGIW
ncbi:MAG: isoprenylcysteine carboxylmethyltransferase family protein [Chloroflexota bacterium]|nr:isoprenylcysteine carboxylmethyltransferase family protein [Chloroflexota bacterium]